MQQMSIKNQDVKKTYAGDNFEPVASFSSPFDADATGADCLRFISVEDIGALAIRSPVRDFLRIDHVLDEVAHLGKPTQSSHHRTLKRSGKLK